MTGGGFGFFDQLAALFPAIGDRFVRRHDAARTSTANTTAADITFDTDEINDGTGYTYTGPQVGVGLGGKYLSIFDIGQAAVSSTRAVGTLIPRINTSTDLEMYRASHRYLRDSGGTMGASIGMAVLDLSNGDDVRVRNPGAMTSPNTDAIGNYATNVDYGGALQLLRLPDINMTHVERNDTDQGSIGQSNISSTRPWADSDGTWTKLTYDDEVLDEDALYPGTGGDITLAAATKYLIVYGAVLTSIDSTRMVHIVRLSIDGTIRQSATGYERDGTSQGPPMSGMYLHETGATTETLFLEATTEAETAITASQFKQGYVQVIELPATAEWIHVDDGANDWTGDLAGTSTWYDTPLGSEFRADLYGKLWHDTTNDAVQNNAGETLPVLAIGWHRWDRDDTVSGTRKMPWSRWDNDGTPVGYGIAGAYSRGQQSTTDTWQAHYTSAALLDLAKTVDLSFQVNDPANVNNSDMGVFASDNRHFLGVQVLNLNTISGTVYGHWRFEDTFSDEMFTTDAPNPATTDDIEVKVWCVPDSITPVSGWTLASKHSTNQYCWRFVVNADGQLFCSISEDGTTVLNTFTGLPDVITPAMRGFRFVFDQTADTIQFYTATELFSEDWTTLGPLKTGKTYAIDDTSTAQTEIGSSFTGNSGPAAGSIYGCEITYGGTVVANVDLTKDAVVSDTEGNTWDTGRGTWQADGTGHYSFSATTNDSFTSSNDEVANPASGDNLEVKVWCVPADITPTLQTYFAANHVAAGDQRVWRFSLGTNGRPALSTYTDGTTGTVETTICDTAIGSTHKGFRVVFDQTANTVIFYTATDIFSETWSQLGTTETSKTNTLFATSTAQVEIGSYAGGTNPFDGEMHGAEISYGGTVVAAPNFTRNAQPTDSVGVSWEALGTVAWVAD